MWLMVGEKRGWEGGEELDILAVGKKIERWGEGNLVRSVIGHLSL